MTGALPRCGRVSRIWVYGSRPDQTQWIDGNSGMGMQMMLVLISGIVGTVLGLRYKVLVLLPVFCVALAIVVLDAVVQGDGFWQMALMMVGSVTCLQLGYVLGGVIVIVTETARAPDHSTARPISKNF